MTVNEIRESGMLEYYVLGLLSEQEIAEVEGYLLQYPELKKDHFEIQQSLQHLATKTGIEPTRNLESDIINTIRSEATDKPVDPGNKKENTDTGKDSSGGFLKNIILGILGALALVLAWFLFEKNNELSNLQEDFNLYTIQCDSTNQANLERIRMFDRLNDPNNSTLNMTATDGYQETNLLFHFNTVTKQNFIQVKNLPTIASNQAFQLWSLKDNTNPIPLTIFKDGQDYIIPVDFEDGTNTYAITIEAEGGAQVPTLSRLIGTVTVA